MLLLVVVLISLVLQSTFPAPSILLTDQERKAVEQTFQTVLKAEMDAAFAHERHEKVAGQLRSLLLRHCKCADVAALDETEISATVRRMPAKIRRRAQQYSHALEYLNGLKNLNNEVGQASISYLESLLQLRLVDGRSRSGPPAQQYCLNLGAGKFVPVPDIYQKPCKIKDEIDRYFTDRISRLRAEIEQHARDIATHGERPKQTKRE